MPEKLDSTYEIYPRELILYKRPSSTVWQCRYKVDGKWLPNASLYHFGILSSSLHNAWMRTVCGRLKSDYRYSGGIVYNNFVWVSNLDEVLRANIEKCSQQVLDIRANLKDTTVGDAYKVIAMPTELVKAHKDLDKAVDEAYGYKGGDDDASRVAFLFKRYEELTSLLPATTVKKKRTKKTNDCGLLI